VSNNKEKKDNKAGKERHPTRLHNRQPDKLISFSLSFQKECIGRKGEADRENADLPVGELSHAARHDKDGLGLLGEDRASSLVLEERARDW
jgi:hypothetical protein